MNKTVLTLLILIASVITSCNEFKPQFKDLSSDLMTYTELGPKGDTLTGVKDKISSV